MCGLGENVAILESVKALPTASKIGDLFLVQAELPLPRPKEQRNVSLDIVVYLLDMF